MSASRGRTRATPIAATRNCRTRNCSDAQFAVSDAPLQVNFVGFSWEDQRNPIASVVLFPPEPPLPAALPAAGPKP